MKIDELLNELSFYGSNCSKDCSGHRAGWYWSRYYNVTNPAACSGSSDSFIKGCVIGANQNATGKAPIGPSVRGAGGKFVKYAGRRNKKTEKGRK